jgi:hypothetical protein
MTEFQPPGQPIREQDIVNPINPRLSAETKADQLLDLAADNRPTVDNFIRQTDAQYGTTSTSNIKLKERILNKSRRPSIRAEKPWFDVEHVRDVLRFRTALDDINDLPKIIADLQKAGITIVKAETQKMLKPRAWGWRAVMYDLRMPNGQLVEYYLSPKELIQANDEVHHPLYEAWRDKNTSKLTADETIVYQRSIETSKDAFMAAWAHYLERTGQTADSVQAVLKETDKLTNI